MISVCCSENQDRDHWRQIQKCSPLWSLGGTARLHCTITNVEQEAVSQHHCRHHYHHHRHHHHHPLPRLNHYHHPHHRPRHRFPPQLYQPAHPQLLRSLGSGWQTTGSSPTASSPSPQTTGCLRTLNIPSFTIWKFLAFHLQSYVALNELNRPKIDPSRPPIT